MSSTVYVDEEDCLGFSVFVAELELIAGNKHSGRVDYGALLELLPKLASTVAKTDRASLKGEQKRCEAAFTDLINGGLPSPVSAGGSPS
eukprot:gene28845-32034_t